jgi:hypothetical protein
MIKAFRNWASKERGFCRLCVASAFLAAGLPIATCGGSSSLSSSGPVTGQPSNGAGAHQNSMLSAVTCSSSTDCWAVGKYTTGTTTRTLIERNSGNGWRIVGSPQVGPADSLGAVACIGEQDCWAVGAYGTDSGRTEPLIEQETGKGWTVVRSPTPGGGRQGALSSVSCADASDCWAVGSAGIERYTGGRWGIVSSDLTLDAVSCTGASDCWAVSSAGIQRYAGSGWSAVTIPNVGHLGLLTGVACASVKQCWAVGATAGGTASHALTLAYTAGEWELATSSDTSLGFSVLGAVTCTSTGDCWSVGQYAPTAGAQTLIEHSTGGGWVVVDSPNVGNDHNILNGVSCASATNCWAVGAHTSSSGSQTLIEHYDGTSWSVVSSPN